MSRGPSSDLANAALDAAGKGLVARLMVEHCGRGGMVLAATHEPLGLSNAGIRL